jgi:plastocyanin
MTTRRKTLREKLLLRTKLRVLVLAVFTLSFAVFAMTPAATAENKAVKISIADFQFTPAEITIAPGESIIWINNDGAPHGLEFPDGSPSSDLLLPGASYTRPFDKPGTYEYNCSVHPYMTGRVIVRAR